MHYTVSEEVDMTMNLARSKPAKQSGTRQVKLGAWNAVDGQKATTHPCSVISGKGDNWWQVNLEAVYDIRVVTITGGDCCGALCYYTLLGSLIENTEAYLANHTSR